MRFAKLVEMVRNQCQSKEQQKDTETQLKGMLREHPTPKKWRSLCQNVHNKGGLCAKWCTTRVVIMPKRAPQGWSLYQKVHNKGGGHTKKCTTRVVAKLTLCVLVYVKLFGYYAT